MANMLRVLSSLLLIASQASSVASQVEKGSMIAGRSRVVVHPADSNGKFAVDLELNQTNMSGIQMTFYEWDSGNTVDIQSLRTKDYLLEESDFSAYFNGGIVVALSLESLILSDSGRLFEATAPKSGGLRICCREVFVADENADGVPVDVECRADAQELELSGPGGEVYSPPPSLMLEAGPGLSEESSDSDGSNSLSCSVLWSCLAIVLCTVLQRTIGNMQINIVDII